MDIQEAHDIATQAENELKREYDVYDVHIHIEPK
ncbi:hypothetical protein MNQ98_14495 [Paenibacillus sp. N3/727]|nr:cation transporter dimerization domain-containing protein [Paenibacillus sp. N3/727]UNK21141.1 hypothetical protein MNQ98_14495 [Paenibacillus sp. N3/727]